VSSEADLVTVKLASGKSSGLLCRSEETLFASAQILLTHV
jgi:hypothetical protein